MLVFRRLLREESDPRSGSRLLCGKIEDAFATVFRQVAMTRFEQSLHAARRGEGELPIERINELWMEANRRCTAMRSSCRDDYAWWWLYIPHFVHSPFYCYAYAFGELLVLALSAATTRRAQAFVPRYLDLLRSGRLAMRRARCSRASASTSPTRPSGTADSPARRMLAEQADAHGPGVELAVAARCHPALVPALGRRRVRPLVKRGLGARRQQVRGGEDEARRALEPALETRQARERARAEDRVSRRARTRGGQGHTRRNGVSASAPRTAPPFRRSEAPRGAATLHRTAAPPAGRGPARRRPPSCAATRLRSAARARRSATAASAAAAPALSSSRCTVRSGAAARRSRRSRAPRA